MQGSDQHGFGVSRVKLISIVAVAILVGYGIGHVTSPSGTAQAGAIETPGEEEAEMKNARINHLEQENARLRTLLNNSRETNEAYREQSNEYLNEIERIIEFEQKDRNITDADGDGCVDAAEIGYYQTDPLNESDYSAGCASDGQ